MFQSLSKTLEDLIRRGSRNLKLEKKPSTHDLFVMYSEDKQEVFLFDDQDRCLSQKTFQPENISLLKLLRDATKRLNDKGFFYQSCFEAPFNLSIVDEEFNVINEVLTIDDDLININSPLMPDLDEELEEFFNSLELE